MSNKLKPCPRCGGKVIFYHTEHHSLGSRRFDFRCESCDWYVSIPHTSKYKSAEIIEEEAVKLWNSSAENIWAATLRANIERRSDNAT